MTEQAQHVFAHVRLGSRLRMVEGRLELLPAFGPDYPNTVSVAPAVGRELLRAKLIQCGCTHRPRRNVRYFRVHDRL